MDTAAKPAAKGAEAPAQSTIRSTIREYVEAFGMAILLALFIRTFLVQAFKMLPPELDVALSIYGDPDRYPSFVEELRELATGDPRISFPGAFPRNDLPDVMSELDVLVVPSRWYENAPGVIFEAFAARMPVVATNLKGMSEFVRHAQNGLLFELEDPRDLSRQLRRLREEPGLLERLRAGITPVKTTAEYASEMEELYASLSLQT